MIKIQDDFYLDVSIIKGVHKLQNCEFHYNGAVECLYTIGVKIYLESETITIGGNLYPRPSEEEQKSYNYLYDTIIKEKNVKN